MANDGASDTGPPEQERMQYANRLELLLTLVGYAVGLGNIWRFPYLAYTYGGGAFLIPYLASLVLLGLPLFVLELGLGQMLRQGTLGIWRKLGLHRLQSVGVAATICTFSVSLYYNVILAWTIYYLGRTLQAMVTTGTLPWDDQVDGFVCPETTLYHRADVKFDTLVDPVTGLYNQDHAHHFWCPARGSASLAGSHEPPPGFNVTSSRPALCPAAAAMQFWERQALQQSSGMDDLGGFHPGMLVAYTLAWLLVYGCIFKGIASSGKVVYVTATLPYIALIAFFVRAVTLPNALTGIRFFVEPDFALLLNAEVWIRAATQIFYSLGVGFGSLIAFGSYSAQGNDFVKEASKVSIINCGTSVFAGFVVFPILGYLAHELSGVNPCIRDDALSDLASIGLSGTGLAFIAFPIAIAQMPGGFFWAILFFITLLCLGIDSQFAMVESVMTVLVDAGYGARMPRPAFAAAVCLVSYLLGLIFVTRGGIYWFELFDYYSCVLAMFVVTGAECIGLMWIGRDAWPNFASTVLEYTGRHLNSSYATGWKFVCPALLFLLTCLSFKEYDLMNARGSVRYPAGTGYKPEWSIWLGWSLAMLPCVALVICAFAFSGPPAATGTSAKADAEKGIDADEVAAKVVEAVGPQQEATVMSL